MSSEKRRYIIAVDFDGVLHRYDTPWIDAETIPDPPVEGAIEWLNEMATRFYVVVMTTRARTDEGCRAVKQWLQDHGANGVGSMGVGLIDVTALKPPALVYIDDRAWRFEGRFPTANEIHQAKPWHKPELPADALIDKLHNCVCGGTLSAERRSRHERQVWACDCGFVTTVAHLAESHGTGPAFSRSSFKGKHIVRPYVPEADLQVAVEALEEIEALKFDPFKSMARAALDRIKRDAP